MHFLQAILAKLTNECVAQLTGYLSLRKLRFAKYKVAMRPGERFVVERLIHRLNGKARASR